MVVRTTKTYVIPIYSGIIGVLMPDKKLLPLSLMPLEVEFTLNPHALYVAGGNFYSQRGMTREYEISNFCIYSHMLFYE